MNINKCRHGETICKQYVDWVTKERRVEFERRLLDGRQFITTGKDRAACEAKFAAWYPIYLREY